MQQHPGSDNINTINKGMQSNVPKGAGSTKMQFDHLAAFINEAQPSSRTIMTVQQSAVQGLCQPDKSFSNLLCPGMERTFWDGNGCQFALTDLPLQGMSS
jgi:hypothetical protein